MKAYGFHPEADEEFAEAAGHYAQIDPELGKRFLQEIERLILDVRRQLGLFRLFDPPIRRHFSTVFPYAVLYVDRPDQVLVIAVMHMRRRPGYWRQRLS